jgi:hypothetical protein
VEFFRGICIFHSCSAPNCNRLLHEIGWSHKLIISKAGDNRERKILNVDGHDLRGLGELARSARPALAGLQGSPLIY